MQGNMFEDGEAQKDRNFITALARGLDVLRCFGTNDIELTNTDFAERTGLPKATVSRVTHTLVKLGYLVADPRKGTYRLGVGVLQLGFAVLSGMEIGDRASDEMRALRDGPNSYVTIALAEQHRDEAIYLAVQRSREDVALTIRVGSSLPLFFSAMGRSILVGMSAERRSSLIKDLQRSDPDGHTARMESLERSLAEYEKYGYCTSYGEWRPDVNGIAVPVHSLNGSRVYGLNVGGPAFHVKRKQLEKVFGPMLIAAAERLSIPL